MTLKHGPYSPSRLDTGNCGLAFWDLYINPDRVKQKHGGLAQERGSAVHEVLEQVTKRLCVEPNAAFSEHQIRDWVTEAVTKYPVAYQEVGEILEMVKNYIRRPPRLLTTDAQTELRLAVKRLDSGEFVECEYDDPAAWVRGRADIFMISDDTTMGLVIDHKTQPNIEDPDKFQMGVYAWVISKIYPFLSEIKTVLHFVRYGCYSEEYTWTKEMLALVEDELLTRIAIIEARQEWDATPHAGCQYCHRKLSCPALENVIEALPDGSYRVRKSNLDILGSTDKAVQIAGFINVAEEALKTAKDNLKEHVKKSGPIAIPGKVWEFRAKSDINWDKVNKFQKQDVCGILEKHGVQATSYMVFNKTSMEAVWLFEDKPLLVRELSENLPQKVSTEFRGYRV